tara:strand:+ start:270 stop:854 length:585 start_codon:yes stop_codon:yes gene_type:complete
MMRSGWIAGFMGLVVLTSLKWSSMCHPTPEGEAMKGQIRQVALAKSEDPIIINDYTPEYLEDFLDKDYSELTWQLLSDVEFRDVYLEELQAYYWKPTFGPKVLSAEGENFYITGYVIPVDTDEDFYVLSRYPFANCFFCGGAGPETVVDLQFPNKAPREYVTDERLTFAGTLKLNADDIYQMNYIIKDAIEYTP